MVDAEAEQLREALPTSTRLMVVADHGMVDSPPERRIDVDEHHELRDGRRPARWRGAASGTSTAAAVRSTTWPPPGGRSSATGPRC